MLLWTILKVALRSLLANRMRTFLAMLGIIIGVGAVISMLALGAGAQKAVMDRVTAMGSDLLIVRPGQSSRGGVRSGNVQSLKLEDAEVILNEIDGVLAVAPLAMGRAQVKYFNRNCNTTLTGTSLTYLDIRNFTLERGRAFTSVEEEHSARVAILGANTALDLFGKQDPVDEIVKVQSVAFRVIGVLQAKGDQGWFNPDDIVIVPYTTAMKQLLGQDYLSEIDIKADGEQDLKKIEKETTSLLRKRHRLRANAEDDFSVRNQADILEMVSSVTRTFTILMGGIAGISLLVGGIGIMNIMLVTVTERTREIGVRKAIGARDRDILRQFLLESSVISGLGGVLGIALGFGIAAGITHFTESPTVVETFSVVLALAVSLSIGIFFGYYPAWRASRLNPIEALRYE